MTELDKRAEAYIETLLDKDIKDLSATELRHLSENGYSVSDEIERRIKQKHNDKQDV